MFFPLMKTEGLSGFLDLVYFPPNNWENRDKSKIMLFAIWPDGDHWSTEKLRDLSFGENCEFRSESFLDKLDSNLCLIYPTHVELPKALNSLPELPIWFSRIPEWRATTGFKNSSAQTSYQGEIFPLPSKASLLTFHPFIQYGNVENRLLVLNVTKNPEIVESELNLYDSQSGALFGSEIVRTNSVTTINLDKYNFKPEHLPAFVSPHMAGIPFGLGIANDGSMLSMEHTHPPASLVLFGNRNSIQGQIKKKWFNNLLGAAK
jgi:hypothetical protein